MNIFGNIRYQDNINNDANFQSFPSAMLMLFRWVSGRHACALIPYFSGLCSYRPSTSSDKIISSSYRIQGGENWNYLMTDCMVQQQCIEVIENYNVTYVNATSPTLIWAGTYLDSVDDAVTLSLLPSDVKVGRMHAEGYAQVESTCPTLSMLPPFAAQPLQPGSGSGCHLLCLVHVR